MRLILNRRREMGSESLPYDAEVQYLQGDGNSYILTNVNLTNNTGIITEIKYCMPTQPDRETWIMGSWDGNCLPYLIGYYGGNYRAEAGPDNSTYWGSIAWDNKFHVARIDTSGTYFDGVKKASTALNNVMNITNIPLFRSYHTNTPVAKQIAYCKIWNLNGTLIRDFIPVRVGTTGYLYDKVSKTLFGNAGSGSFTLGPDIKEIEYLQSSGTQYIDTGVVPGLYKDFEIELKYQSTAIDSVDRVFGALEMSGGVYNQYSIHRMSSSSGVYKFATKEKGQSNIETETISSTGIVEIHITGRNMVINNNSYVNNFNDTAGLDSVSLGLLSWIRSTVVNITPGGRIYYCKIKKSGTLVRDFIPVRAGSTGYMYDKVSGTLFGNAGSDNFILGPDV